MNCYREDLRLYAVTDRRWLNGRALSDEVRAAIQGGVSCVQLREKNLDFESFLHEAIELREVCNSMKVPFVINDNVKLAQLVGADGVHVGQSDMEAGDVRSLIGDEKIMGVSVQTVQQAKLAESKGADYLGVGAVFTTASKDDADSVSYETLKEICNAVSIPVVAIGGINEENVSELAGSGIAGVAVISALFAQDDIKAAAERLLEQLNTEALSNCNFEEGRC